MGVIEHLLSSSMITVPFIPLRTTFLDWAFDEWGTAGGLTVGLIIMCACLYLDWKQKQANETNDESITEETSDERSAPPDSPPPPDEE